jgi:uncharacterized protein
MKVNYLGGVRGLLERWHGGGVALNERPVIASDGGNLNIHGSASDTAAYIFAPHEPEFLGSLEPRIRPLVVALIGAMDCVTYSSCQGHPATPHSPSRPASVGLLARRPEEGAHLHAALSRLAERAMACVVSQEVAVHVAAGTLDSDDGPHPCVDLEFLSATGDEAAYFAVIDDAVAMLTRLILDGMTPPPRPAPTPPTPAFRHRRGSFPRG